ncbi:hypothetical protein EPUS_06140 [Endocarpon pusillum Z07020]|uniref:Uncharacterized protein n=1 Tax=Endocarpon pusillum (strain Z07020 / HMAS-L-300199) TaxID=1263415 RepID=U1GVH4_ENDPU|nr:uncharacterized protein EPUS_06140 [Endocarpon pusillum Z07020]ERF76478.1 hypothetical protein EPUS_06140 [Endocarpon pusillum Z07020]
MVTFFQTVHASGPGSVATTPRPSTSGSNNAATRLSEAIDEFLGDVEQKFKVMNDEILTKLDDMAERCDRLEAELLLREAEGAKITSGSTDGSS